MIKRKPLSLKLPPGQIDEIHRLIGKMPAPPTFTAVVESALDIWIDRVRGELSTADRKARK